MSLIKSLSVGLRLDASSFNSDVNAPINHLARLNAAAADAQGSLSGVGQGSQGGINAGQSAAQAGLLGAQLRAAINEGLSPLNTISTKLGGQFNALAGTLTTLARRIDSAMKFPASQAALEQLRQRLEGISPVTANLVGRFAQFRAATNWLKDLGDVSGRSLDQIDRRSFSMPIAGATKLGSVMAGPVVSGVNAATSSVRSFGSQVLVALGFFGLAYKIVDFFKSGITGAIALNETVSKTKEVFQGSTDSVVANANALSKLSGATKGTILDASSSIGLIGKAAGQSDQESAKLANRLVTLAAQATSFYNVPLDKSLEKIRSGLVGESEPLRAFGILLSEEAVQAEALSLGLAKNKKELDERSKVMARASLIEKGLAVADGDLERTAGSAANQFRKAGGGFENFANSIGTLLLPAVTAGIEAFNELQSTVIEVVDANQGYIEQFGSFLKSGFDQAGVVIRNFGTAWEIAQLKVLEFTMNVGANLAVIPDNLSILANYLANNWVNLIRDGLNAAASLFINFFTNLTNVGAAIGTFLVDPTRGFEFKWTPLLDNFKATADQLPEMIKPALKSLQSEIDGKWETINAAEAARAKKLVPIGRKNPLAKEDKPKDFEPPKLAAAVDLASKEGYSAIVKASGIGSKDTISKSIDNTAKKQLEVSQKTLAAIEKRPAANNPVELFSMA